MIYVCVEFLFVVRYLSMGLHQEEDFLAHGLCRQVVFVIKLDVEAQEKNFSKNSLLDACHLWRLWPYEELPKGLSHNCVWGS
jgi:hypothetical protein